MSEPKYQLNRRDEKRWHDLLVRHCLEFPAKPGGRVKQNKKYPPLTRQENIEFEALTRKRDEKYDAHPLAKAALRHAQRQMRKIDKLLARQKQMMKRLKIKVD